jgi:hypothetical protein
VDRLKELAAMQMDWQASDDAVVGRKFNSLSQDLDRMRRLKSGGISCFPQVVAKPLSELVESFKEAGVFLAPVGELEGWLASEGIQSSKANKAAWANAAAAKIQSIRAARCDVSGFVREVARYLEEKSWEAAKPSGGRTNPRRSSVVDLTRPAEH